METAVIFVVVIIIFVLLIFIFRAADKSQKKRLIEIQKRPFIIQAKRHMQIISESIDIVHKSKNIKTILSRYETLFQNIDSLKKIEEQFPDILSPPTSELESSIKKDKSVFLSQFALEDANEEVGRANAVTRKSSKISYLDKALLDLYEIKKEVDDDEVKNEISKKEQEVRMLIEDIKPRKED
jgi:hypothetical protein